MPSPDTLRDLAHDIERGFEDAGIGADEARLDAELLVRHVMRWDRARWVSDARTTAAPVDRTMLEELVARRLRREPMAYVLGRCEFWGLDFEIGPAVLIPRPETEIIVEQALARVPGHVPCRIADVGTGSGCLAVSLAVERPLVRLTATDISTDALAQAARNAKRHGVEHRITFLEADLFGDTPTHSLDGVVSNPPYVDPVEASALPPEVRNYEPAAALFGGAGGLELIHRVVEGAGVCLRPGGWLVMEIGMGQAAAVQEFLRQSGSWSDVAVVTDLQGIPRTAIAVRV